MLPINQAGHPSAAAIAAMRKPPGSGLDGAVITAEDRADADLRQTLAGQQEKIAQPVARTGRHESEFCLRVDS